MKKYVVLLITIISSVSQLALALNKPEPPKKLLITLEEAREIAVRSYPGTVVQQHSTKTTKGYVYKYSFDIQDDTALQTVVIDAKTGKVLRYRVKDYQGQ